MSQQLLHEDILSFLSEKANKTYPDSIIRNKIKEKFGLVLSPKYFKFLREKSRTEKVSIETAISLSSKFSGAVKSSESEDVTNARKNHKAKKSFTPRFVNFCMSREYYFVPQTGFCKCLGPEETNVLGSSIKVLAFKPALPDETEQKRLIPLNRVLGSGIRLPATEQEMESLFSRMASGQMCSSMPTKSKSENNETYRAKWMDMLFRGDLDDYADIILNFIHSKKGQYGPSMVEIECADKAMKWLAAEHCVVMDWFYEDSLKLLKDVSGFKKAADLKLRSKAGEPTHDSP